MYPKNRIRNISKIKNALVACALSHGTHDLQSCFNRDGMSSLCSTN